MCVIMYATTMLISPNEITNMTIVYDYYMCGWRGKMKVQIFHSLLNELLDA
jgi:hypothetical protein